MTMTQTLAATPGETRRLTLPALLLAGLGAAIVAATVAGPALAQDHAAFAIRHFNQDADSVDDIRTPDIGRQATVATRGGSNLGNVYGRLNADFDSVGDLRGTTGQVTIVSGEPAYARDIFARLRAESLEDE